MLYGYGKARALVRYTFYPNCLLKDCYTCKCNRYLLILMISRIECYILFSQAWICECSYLHVVARWWVCMIRLPSFSKCCCVRDDPLLSPMSWHPTIPQKISHAWDIVGAIQIPCACRRLHNPSIRLTFPLLLYLGVSKYTRSSSTLQVSVSVLVRRSPLLYSLRACKTPCGFSNPLFCFQKKRQRDEVVNDE